MALAFGDLCRCGDKGGVTSLSSLLPSVSDRRLCPWHTIDTEWRAFSGAGVGEKQRGFWGAVVGEEQRGFWGAVVGEEQRGFWGAVVGEEQRGFWGAVVGEKQRGFWGAVVGEEQMDGADSKRRGELTEENGPSRGAIAGCSSLNPSCRALSISLEPLWSLVLGTSIKSPSATKTF